MDGSSTSVDGEQLVCQICVKDQIARPGGKDIGVGCYQCIAMLPLKPTQAIEIYASTPASPDAVTVGDRGIA